MSDPKPISDAVNEITQLSPRQVTIHSWRVLSWREDELTAYKVNLRHLTCECPDQTMNKKDNEVCDHIAVALHSSDVTMDIGTALNFDLLERQRDLEKMGDRIEQSINRLESAAADAMSEDGDADETPSEPEQKSDVEYVYEFLDSRGVPGDKIRVWEENGSIQIDTKEKLDDDEFAVLRETDEIWYDGDEGRNYVTEDNIRELLS